MLTGDKQVDDSIDKFLEAKSGRRPKRKQDGTLGRVHKTDSIQANSKRGSQSKLEYLLRNDDDVCSE